jgi:hypothetical protein
LRQSYGKDNGGTGRFIRPAAGLVAPFEIARLTVTRHLLRLGDFLQSHSLCNDIAVIYHLKPSRRRTNW